MLSSIIKSSLLSLPRLVKRALVIALDISIAVISVWLAFGLLSDQWGFFQGGQWWTFLGVIGFSFPLFIIFGLYRAIFRYIGTTAFATIVRVFIAYACLFFSAFTLIGIEGVPRSIGIIQPILLFLGIGASRYFMRYWLGAVDPMQMPFFRSQPLALIYGAGSAGRQLATLLFIDRKILVKGFIDDDESMHGNTVNGIRVHSSADLNSLIKKYKITDILLAIPSVSQARRNEIIESLNGCGVRVRTLPGLFDLASGRVRMSDLHDLDMNDLLGRKVVPPNLSLMEKNIKGKIVLVTGAGGSIGSELCRQIIKFSPNSLILVDMSEYSLYSIFEELKRLSIEWRDLNLKSQSSRVFPIKIIPHLASVRDRELMFNIFSLYKPDTVFHAAAYKHVPLVEQNPVEGVRNNVFGTYNCTQAALEFGVSNFILVSTDKAVRPTNIMGASKRIAELVVQAAADCLANMSHPPTKFSMVRFGNVLGSSGSVAPLFSAQIQAGGPITLTHPEVTRYFMTIPEAAQLVIQSSAMASGGDVFVLDMGQPIRIYDLAVKMVYLSGLMVRDESNPLGDIEIKVMGLRPGEKLYEELLIGNDPRATDHPKIMKSHEKYLPWNDLELSLEELNIVLQTWDQSEIFNILKKLVPDYKPAHNSGEA
uniref:polysaccharide biosynthesis protein n=1 Tax=Polynucleobacter sp. TaxID=2029855 RepID=UPI004048CF4D